MMVLLVSGSPRPDSRTVMAVEAFARMLEAAGMTTETIDLARIDLPTFRGAPVAPIALQWRERLQACNALILASPEFHGSLSSAMKTFLDHTTEDEFRDRPVGFIGVASSVHGGANPIRHMQDVVLSMLAAIVAPALQISDARNAFDGDGAFADPALHDRAALLVERLAAAVSRNYPNE
jgi:NAD(P)H-dependent FMN reductase